MMQIPQLLVLTDRAALDDRGRSLPDAVAAAVDAGAPAVLYREKDLEDKERRRLGQKVAAVVHAAGSDLVVASDAGLADYLDAGALHLAADDPVPSAWEGPFGRSCHNLAEVEAARDQGAAYVTLSPVFTSPSKPDYGPPLELGGLANVVRSFRTLPVVALGGIDADRAMACLAAGATGVAVQSAVMGAEDPATATRQLLDAIQQASPEENP